MFDLFHYLWKPPVVFWYHLIRRDKSSEEEGSESAREHKRSKSDDRLLTDKEVDPVLRVPFIQNGYRPPGRSWHYYLRSLFRLHNDTLSIWLYFLSFLTSVTAIIYYGHFVHFFTHPSTWGLLGFGICSAISFLLGSIAYFLRSKSIRLHYTSLQLMYTGLGLYLFGSSIIMYIGSFTRYNDHWWVSNYISLSCLFSFVISIGCSLAHMKYDQDNLKKAKIIRTTLITLYVSYTITIPAYYQITECLSDSYLYCNIHDLKLHLVYIGLFLLSFILIFLSYPERLKPGNFDFYGSSVHYFQFFVTIASLLQFHTCYKDWNNQSDLDRAWVKDNVSFFDVFGYIFITTIVNGALIFLTRFPLNFSAQQEFDKLKDWIEAKDLNIGDTFSFS